MSEPKSLVGNAADPEQVHAGAHKSKRRAEKELDDLRRILDTPFGRRVIWRYLDQVCGVFRLSHMGEQTHETAFNEGNRNVGNTLMAEVLKASPEAFLVMRSEATKTEDETNA